MEVVNTMRDLLQLNPLYGEQFRTLLSLSEQGARERRHRATCWVEGGGAMLWGWWWCVGWGGVGDGWLGGECAAWEGVAA